MASRKTNGEGTIYQRKDGSFTCQISTAQGRKTFTGNTRKNVIEKKKRYEEQQNELEQLKARMSLKGINSANCQTSLTQWVYDWIQLYKKPPMVKPTTYGTYLFLWEAHIKPFFGDTPLASVTNADVQMFYNYKASNGRIDGKKGGLSPKSIRNLHNMLNSSLQKAVGKIIEQNPADDTDRPSVPKPDIRILTNEEMSLFLAEVLNEQHRCAMIVSLLTGVRMGELLALTWDDIDFTNKQIRINKDIIRAPNLEEGAATKTHLIVQPTPKTQSSNRTIPMTDEINQLLFVERQRQKQAQSSERESSRRQQRDCRNLNPDNIVFPTRVGTHIDPRSFEKRISRVAERCNIPHISVHALRHTFATRLIEQNVPIRVVQELLGHSEGTTTMRYTHALENEKRKAVDSFNGILSSIEGASQQKSELQ